MTPAEDTLKGLGLFLYLAKFTGRFYELSGLFKESWLTKFSL